MLASIKINTAILICFTFIFRLLFINVGATPTFNSQHACATKLNCSTILKRNNSTESQYIAKNDMRPILEICEDGSDDDDKFKSKTFLFTRAFYLLVTNKTVDNVQKIIPTDKLLSNTLFNRHIAFQVFRI